MIEYIEDPNNATRKKKIRISMNLLTFQVIKSIHRNLFHFYTQTMKDQKDKLKKHFHLLSQEKKNKNLEISLSEETKNLHCEN